MRFFENDLNLETDSIFNFLCSALIILVFAPIKLSMEVARKSVFLQKKQIDMLLFTALAIGIVCTIAMSIAHMVGSKFNLFTGRDPVVVYLVGCVVLIVLYFAFNTADLITYSDSMVKRVVGQQKEPKESEEPEEPKEVKKNINLDVMSMPEIMEYKDKLEKELEKLALYTQPEVKQRMDEAVGETPLSIDLSNDMLECLEEFSMEDPGLADIESLLLQ